MKQRKSVNFVVGADALAPGVSRVVSPLLEGLIASRSFEMRPMRFPTLKPAAFYPYLFAGLPLQLLSRPASLAHFGNAWYAHVASWIPSPTVVTCHHQIGEEDLQQGSNQVSLHRRLHLRLAVRGLLKASTIVCDSQSVAAHVTALAPQAELRIRVIYPGLSPVFRPQPSPQDRTRPPYVLYVGSEQQRKNLRRVIEAVALARTELPDLELVKVGASDSPDGRAAFLHTMKENGLEKAVTIFDSVNDACLAELYRGAAVTVLASLQEGFGFPPLEAMACGCPAIVSDRGSLPEVVDSAALIVDPLDPRSIGRAIESIIQEPDLRSDLVQRGLRQSAKFDRRLMVQQYEEVYAEVLTR